MHVEGNVGSARRDICDWQPGRFVFPGLLIAANLETSSLLANKADGSNLRGCGEEVVGSRSAPMEKRPPRQFDSTRKGRGQQASLYT